MPTDDFAALAAELRRLDQTISQGEWVYDEEYAIILAPVKHAERVARCAVASAHYGLRSNAEAESNARGLATLRNMIPQLIVALDRVAEVERERDAIVSLLQRKLQPAGSPPPGGAVQLAEWIVESVRRDNEALRAEADLYRRGYEAMGAADISEYLALCARARPAARPQPEAT